MSNPISPDHYQFSGSQVIDNTEHLSFAAGNVVKYVARAGRKHPEKHLEDLEKALWYLKREIELVKRMRGEDVPKVQKGVDNPNHLP